MNEMNEYTVVLHRPIVHTSLSEGVYVAINVLAPTPEEATEKAIDEAKMADRMDKTEMEMDPDYTLLAAFEGAHTPVLFGWQLKIARAVTGTKC